MIRKVLIFILLLCFTVAGFVPPARAAQVLPEKKLELHAFYPAQMTFSESSKKYIDALDTVSFAWGRMYRDLQDGVVTQLGKNGNTMFYYPFDYIDVLKYAKSKNKPIQLNIFSDSTNAVEILPYKEQRDRAVNAIEELLNSDVGNGSGIYFDGVVIDFEGLQNKDANGKVIVINGRDIKSWYNEFLTQLSSRLKAINKTLYVAVNPLLNYSGYDYKRIAAVADRMIIMAHDYEPVTKLNKSQVIQYSGYNSISPIDGLAPIKKLRLAFEDVKNTVDKTDQAKVMLQINFDAAQWRYSMAAAGSWNKAPGSVMSIETRNTPTYQMIYDRIHNIRGKSTGMTYSYNNELQSPVLQFYDEADHTYNIAIYEDSRSVKAKVDLVKEYGLGGISLWSLANVPDFDDKTSKAYGLDVWSNIIAALPVKAPAATGTKAVFSDKVVEIAVRKQLMKPAGTIYSNELLKVYRLAIPTGVKSLVDLKKLPNLEYLDVSNARLSSISSISSLKNLRVLYLQRNSIADITPLKGLTKLEVLSLNGNRISGIGALSGLTSLTELYIRDNLIWDYSPLANLKKLNILYLKGNKSANYIKLDNIKKGLLEKDF